MFTIKENTNNEIIVKKSKFISYIYKVDNINEINNYIQDLSNKYTDASHICYAYIVDNNIKYFEDKEPIGSSGLAILKILKKHKLNYVLGVVVRYFGGIKLGTGPLTRTYSKSINKLINKNNIIELIHGYEIKVTFPYKDTKDIDYLLRNEKITNKIYFKDVVYTFITTNKDILNGTNATITDIKEILIEKI